MSAPRRHVFVVPRAADVEALRRHQIAGALMLDSSAPERIAEHPHALRERVFLVPTEDAASQAAFERAAAAFAGLPTPAGTRRVVRMVRLSGLAAGQGVAEWLVGRTTEDFVKVAQRATPWVAAAEVSAPRAGLALVAPTGATELPRAVRLLDAPPEVPPTWLVPDLIPKGEPVLIAGEGGTMKTTLALHLACAVAAGGPLFAHGAPLAEAPVLVVTGEDPRGVVANRCEAIARGHGWDRARVLGNLHVLALAGTDLAAPRWRAHLVAELERTGAGVVILDPLANLATGDENSNTERRPVVETWRALARGGATTPVLVHHAGKRGDGTRSKRDRIRGGTAIPDGSRCTLFLEPAAGGVRVENVKQSRAVAHPAFIVVADVTSDVQNSALWTSARFTRTTQRRAAMTHASQELLRLIVERPGLSGNALREASGLQRLAVSDGLTELQRAGLVEYEDGPRGSQLWHPTDDGRGTVSDCFPTVSDQSPATVSDCFPPKGGRKQSETVGVAGEPGDAERDEAAYLADERAALEDPAA